jgi:hypothetical protein
MRRDTTIISSLETCSRSSVVRRFGVPIRGVVELTGRPSATRRLPPTTIVRRLLTCRW